MLRQVFDFFMGTPIPLAIVGSHFLCYSLLAWCVLLVRALSGHFSAREWMLLALFSGCIVLEVVQLAVAGFRFCGSKTWGVPRWFGVFAPLLWAWAAYALSEMWGRFAGWRRVVMRCGIVSALTWVALSQNVNGIHSFYREGARWDAVVAARRIARTISSDYAGPSRQKRARRRLHEYFTSRRPVVFGDFSAAAWMVRGQSEGAVQGDGRCPYPDDYLFVRVGSGYGKIKTVNAEEYDYIRSVRGGLGTEWRLFRRKTTPHR